MFERYMVEWCMFERCIFEWYMFERDIFGEARIMSNLEGLLELEAGRWEANAMMARGDGTDQAPGGEGAQKSCLCNMADW